MYIFLTQVHTGTLNLDPKPRGPSLYYLFSIFVSPSSSLKILAFNHTSLYLLNLSLLNRYKILSEFHRQYPYQHRAYLKKKKKKFSVSLYFLLSLGHIQCGYDFLNTDSLANLE